MSAALREVVECDSTQDEVHRLAAEGAPEGTAVLAARQRAGRGSRGRAWASAEGGLWLSVLWRPGPSDDPRLLSVRAGLAVAPLLEAPGGMPPVQLKWPNDLLVDGRKVGGILCEARWRGTTLEWVAIGVGVNVRNAPPPAVRVPAASLSEWRPDLAPAALAPSIAGALARLSGRPTLTPEERAAWRARDALAGRRLRAPVAGVVRGLAEDGTLEVEVAGAVRQLAAGDAPGLEPA